MKVAWFVATGWATDRHNLDLSQLKLQAKELLRSYQRGEDKAMARIHPEVNLRMSLASVAESRMQLLVLIPTCGHQLNPCPERVAISANAGKIHLQPLAGLQLAAIQVPEMELVRTVPLSTSRSRRSRHRSGQETTHGC